MRRWTRDGVLCATLGIAGLVGLTATGTGDAARVPRSVRIAPAARSVSAGLADPDPGPAARFVSGGRRLAFVPNRGQTDDRVLFHTAPGSPPMFLTRDQMRLRVPGARAEGAFECADLFLEFEGSSDGAQVVAEEPLERRCSYYLGKDPARWVSGAPTFARLRQTGLYDGIDVVYRGSAEGALEYDVVVAPEADLDDVVIRVHGADGLSLDGEGALVIDTPVGRVRHVIPATYEIAADGTRRDLAAEIRLLDDDAFGFVVPGRDPTASLVVDPVIAYLSFTTAGVDVYTEHGILAVDATGRAIVCGDTNTFFDTSFPTRPGLASMADDAYVERFSIDGSGVEWSTLFGGSSAEWATGIDVNASSQIAITGFTRSDDMPTPNGHDTALGTSFNSDAFVALLTADGTLDTATYVGGDSTSDEGVDVALGDDGDVWLLAHASDFGGPFDYPTTAGAPVTAPVVFAASQWAVTKLASGGASLVWSTLVGSAAGTFGTGRADRPGGIGVQASGDVVVGGIVDMGSEDPQLPVTQGALQTARQGSSGVSGFVARLAADGTSIEALSYVDGSAAALWDGVSDVVADGSSVFVVGTVTGDLGFALTGGPVVTTTATQRGFVVELNDTFTTVQWGTYLPHATVDDAALGGPGLITVTGVAAPQFPFPNGIQKDESIDRGQYVAQFGTGTAENDLVGFTGVERIETETLAPHGSSVAATLAGQICFAGGAKGRVDATPGAFQTSGLGSHDCIVGCIDLDGGAIPPPPDGGGDPDPPDPVELLDSGAGRGKLVAKLKPRGGRRQKSRLSTDNVRVDCYGDGTASVVFDVDKILRVGIDQKSDRVAVGVRRIGDADAKAVGALLGTLFDAGFVVDRIRRLVLKKRTNRRGDTRTKVVVTGSGSLLYGFGELATFSAKVSTKTSPSEPLDEFPLCYWYWVDDRRNGTYGSGDDLTCPGSYSFDASTRQVNPDGTWSGPFVRLRDDGPYTHGGSEPVGAVAGDQVWSAVWIPGSGFTEPTAIQHVVTRGDGGMVWPAGLAGLVWVDPDASGAIPAKGRRIPSRGNTSLTVYVDTNKLDPGFVEESGVNLPPSVVVIRSSLSAWRPLRMGDDGKGGDAVANDGVFTITTAAELSAGDGDDDLGPLDSYHDAPPAPGQLVAFNFEIDGEPYEDCLNIEDFECTDLEAHTDGVSVALGSGQRVVDSSSPGFEWGQGSSYDIAAQRNRGTLRFAVNHVEDRPQDQAPHFREPGGVVVLDDGEEARRARTRHQTESLAVVELLPGARRGDPGLRLADFQLVLRQFDDDENPGTVVVVNGGGVEFVDGCTVRVTDASEIEVKKMLHTGSGTVTALSVADVDIRIKFEDDLSVGTNQAGLKPTRMLAQGTATFQVVGQPGTFTGTFDLAGDVRVGFLPF